MKRRSGFTLIEVMTVVSIILILAGMLFVGARYMTASAKRDKTRAMLQTLRGMMTERESATDAKHVRDDVDLFFRDNFPTLPAVTNVTTGRINITLPDASTLISMDENIPARYPTAQAAPTPQSPVYAAQQMMQLLIATPANKTTIAGMPSESMLKTQAGPAVTPPVLVDGYGYPIILCPGRGLANVTLNGGANQTITGPDGKPFFASAGPDGNFQTGDDNVYSFSN